MSEMRPAPFSGLCKSIQYGERKTCEDVGRKEPRDGGDGRVSIVSKKELESSGGRE